MKITHRRLRELIKEALKVHVLPVDLDTVDSEEAYGIGYAKGQEQDIHDNYDGFDGTVELADMTHDIADDITAEGMSTDQMPPHWRRILGNCLGGNDQ